ncbi:MAG: Rrf2 family transcriptional regulator [Clostridiales bacterium]|nr:Rrf2 family transcriptional regulator [Clostridiales bacterium]
MKLSVKSKLALTALLELALQPDTPQPGAQLAERLGISKVYLEQIMTPLRRSGLVSAQKGVQGGYQLAARPADVTAAQILELTEPALFASDPSESGDLAGQVLDQLLLCPLDRTVRGTLGGLTLQQMVESFRQRQSSAGFMFYI